VHVVVGKDMKKRSLPAKYAERFAAYLNPRSSDGVDSL
jgi:acyl-CoA thioester hydrolase